MPKVAVIYLSYHSDEFLPDLVEAMRNSVYPKDRTTLVMVDNPHPEFGSSVPKINELVVSHSKKALPEVVVLAQSENKGFCGGNNAGIDWALRHGFDYVFLHNQDGYFSPDCLIRLVNAMEADPNIGCSQSLVMLHGTEKINSIGNSFNFLGFGYISNFGFDKKLLDLGPVAEVGYASGAALFMRADLIRKYGALDPDLFAYHEDVEYSLRLKLAGFKVAVVPSAVFYHKYVFNRNSSKFYYMERNRYAVLLMYYRFATLFLLFPMLFFMELGISFFFFKNGWSKEKIAVEKYWMSPKNLRLWLKKRKYIQSIRKISDRKFLSMATAEVVFGEKYGMDSPLLRYVANPIMKVYKMIVQMVLFW